MFFNFTFRDYLTNPTHLAEQLQTSAVRGLKMRVILVFLAGLIVFGMRGWWGMGTESLTPLLTSTTITDYTIARYIAFLGTLLWSIIYLSFHFFGFAYILKIITNIPFKKLLPLQIIIASLLLIEKGLVYLVFLMKGVTTNVSFLSFGPLAATYLETNYLILFLNQLTITTALIIALQFSFISTYNKGTNKKKLLWILLGIHIAMALITASIGLIPLESLWERLIGGGVGVE